MKQNKQTQYEVEVNGMPDYEQIPKAALEPIAKKFLDDILKQMEQQTSDKNET